jgi:predicted nucleic acid-binding Zn ribbon protein
MAGPLMLVMQWPTLPHSLVVSTMSALDTQKTMTEQVAELGWSISKWGRTMGSNPLISQATGPAHAMISLAKLVLTSVLLRISQSPNWADM